MAFAVFWNRRCKHSFFWQFNSSGYAVLVAVFHRLICENLKIRMLNLCLLFLRLLFSFQDRPVPIRERHREIRRRAGFCGDDIRNEK